MSSTLNVPVVVYELVGPPIADKQGHLYYGVWRSFAQVGTTPWEQTSAHEVWKDYCCPSWQDLGEWDSFLPSLDVARSFQSRFAAHGYRFGIIAIYPCESAENVAAIERLPGYMGLDVSTTEPLSVLRGVWEDVDYRDDPEGPEGLGALWALPRKYFRDRVNKWGLLSRYEDAALFCDVMRALEKVDVTHQTPKSVRVLAVQEILD